jgi:hypothetical protein
MSNTSNGFLKDNSLPDEELLPSGLPRGHWYAPYPQRVCHMLDLTTEEFEIGALEDKIPRYHVTGINRTNECEF